MECNDTDICYADVLGSQMSDCIDGSCLPLGNAGDECDDDNPCYGKMTCDGVCTPKLLGEDCEGPMYPDPDLPWRSIGITCDIGLYCNSTNLCSPMLVEGDDCTPDGTPCGSNLVCGPNGTCIKLFSLQESSACSGDYQCEVYALCVESVCTAYNAPKLTECSDDSECPLSACECSYYVGKGYCQIDTKYVCLEEEQTMYSCFAEKCPASYFSLSAYSCQKSECNDAVKKYYSCTLCEYQEEPRSPCITRDDKDKYCPELETWEKLLILAVIVVVVIVIIVIITICCCCYKPKEGYDSVK